MAKSKKALFWVSLLILAQFCVLIPIPTVHAQFTYGNWNWDEANKILTIIANPLINEGNTEANAYGFQDIVDCGLVPSAYYNVSQSGCQFEFNFRIVIGDGTQANTTWFVDEDVQITFNDGILSTLWQILIEVKAYGHLVFGELENLTEKITTNGISLIDLEDSYSHYLCRATSTVQTSVYFYSCHLIGSTQNTIITGINLRIWNCNLAKNVYVSDASTSDIFNSIFSKGSYAVSYPKGSWNKVCIFEMASAIYLRYASTLTNIYARNNTQIFEAYSLSADVYFINVDSDTWVNSWAGTPSTNEVYRQYEFDLTIFFENGTSFQNANVTISNDYLAISESWLTFANGSIPTQVYSMGHYNQTGGNDIYDYNPYHLAVTFDGYETYSSLINITQKENLKISLKKQAQFFPFFGLGVVFAGMIGLVVALGLAVKRR